MTPNDRDLLLEIATSMRLLLRHAMTERNGAGVPPVELLDRIRKLDQAMGKPAHVKETKNPKKPKPITNKPKYIHPAFREYQKG